MASAALERSWILMMAGLYLSIIGVCVGGGGIAVYIAGIEPIGEALARLCVVLCWIGGLLLIPSSFWYQAERDRERAAQNAEIRATLAAVTGGRNP